MNALATTKRLLKRSLPKGLVLAIQEYRHAKVINTITVDSDADLKPIQHLIRPGDTVLDLGANMGYFTKFFSDLVGSTGSVHSVEPIPSTTRILKYVVKKLRLTNVRVLNVAVSDTAGSVTMEIPLFDSGEENIFEAKIVDGTPHQGFEKVTVASGALDVLFHDILPAIRFVKCDIEGHENTALRGAQRLLNEVKPAWMMEVWGNPAEPNSKAAQTFATFAKAGYTAFWFDGTNMRTWRSGEISVNYFFLTEPHSASLKMHLPFAT